MSEQSPSSAMSWNARVINEFRENNGKVGGMFAGAPMVLVTTAGRRTGKPYTNPVNYLRDSDRFLVFGSNLGRPRHPDWYLNMLVNSQVTMEIGTDEGHVKPFATRAVALDGEERDRLYERQCSIDPTFRQYQEKTTRTIPVVALHPLDLGGAPVARGGRDAAVVVRRPRCRTAPDRRSGTVGVGHAVRAGP